LPEDLRYQEFIHQIDTPKAYTILLPNYNAPVLFYKKKLKDRKITIKQELEFLPEKRNVLGKEPLTFELGEKVMICETSVRNSFKKHYGYKVLKKWKSCELIVVEKKLDLE